MNEGLPAKLLEGDHITSVGDGFCCLDFWSKRIQASRRTATIFIRSNGLTPLRAPFLHFLHLERKSSYCPSSF